MKGKKPNLILFDRFYSSTLLCIFCQNSLGTSQILLNSVKLLAKIIASDEIVR